MKKLLPLLVALLAALGTRAQTTVNFTSSNLPIVVLNTYGQTIPDDPKIDAYMGIINNGPGRRNHLSDPYNDYHNKIGIEVRGSSSQMFPQLSYSVESRDVNNAEHDTTILGLPEENAWILYAPYTDKTCMRNVLAYDIANHTGHYASRTRYCELVLNGQYQGIYVLMEKIKRDANRVDIKKVDPIDTTGNKLTGGYIFKIDKPTGTGGNAGWDSNFRASSGQTIRFLYEYPSADDIVPKQAAYLRAYVDSTERALAGASFADSVSGYRKYLDRASFIDYFLLNEVSKNVDGLRLSTYLHKNRRSEGGKLVAGPAWDYNLAFWNADYCGGDNYLGWAYQFNNICGGGSDVPFWWARLLQDPAYANAVKCRWTALRQTTLHLDSLYAFVDTTAAHLQEAQVRHFQTWPILGTYVWPNPSPLPTSYAGEIAALKRWLRQRIGWLDTNMPGTCGAISAAAPAAAAPTVAVYPNPFTQALTFRPTLPSRAVVRLTIADLSGRVVATADYGLQSAGAPELPVPAAKLAAGVYMLHATVGEQRYNVKVVKE